MYYCIKPLVSNLVCPQLYIHVCIFETFLRHKLMNFNRVIGEVSFGCGRVGGGSKPFFLTLATRCFI